MNTYQPKEGPLFSYVGPDLHQGPMPVLFYFALSASASLEVDPFSQLVQFSDLSHLRIFSCSLPGHTNHPSSFEPAIASWAKHLISGDNILLDFINNVSLGVNALIEEGFIDTEKMAVAGLSRGALFATHLAAKNPLINTILGFAPLTKLESVEEFVDLPKEIYDTLDLRSLSSQLINKKVRFYIGNRDTRVSTLSCFEFINELVDANFQNNAKSPPVELIISPSCGRYGHGTPPHIFKEGASWIKTELRL